MRPDRGGDTEDQKRFNTAYGDWCDAAPAVVPEHQHISEACKLASIYVAWGRYCECGAGTAVTIVPSENAGLMLGGVSGSSSTLRQSYLYHWRQDPPAALLES